MTGCLTPPALLTTGYPRGGRISLDQWVEEWYHRTAHTNRHACRRRVVGGGGCCGAWGVQCSYPSGSREESPSPPSTPLLHMWNMPHTAPPYPIALHKRNMLHTARPMGPVHHYLPLHYHHKMRLTPPSPLPSPHILKPLPPNLPTSPHRNTSLPPAVSTSRGVGGRGWSVWRGGRRRASVVKRGPVPS